MNYTKTVVIPAAGLSKRFTDEGYTGPKGLLQMRMGNLTAPLLYHTLLNLPQDWDIIIVTRPEWRIGFYRLLLRTGRRPRVLAIEKTRGQSETILQGLTCCDEEPILVVNCDMWFSPRALLSLGTCGIALHHDDRPGTEPPIYSYVDDRYTPSKFVEKRRISDWAITGAWSFSSARPLAKAIEKQIQNDEAAKGEYFLSGALNNLSETMVGVVLEPRDWKDLGTPEAVKAAGGFLVI
jgi:choline kinase